MSDWGQPAVEELPPHVLRCPHGHTSFQPVDGHFWCQRCARSDRLETDGSFQHVENVQSGERLDREDVRELEQRAQKERDGGAAD